jgi:homoserine kinase
MSEWITAYAPASIGNVGPGFDVFGLALKEPGDRVCARKTAQLGVRILEITGDQGRLPKEAAKNTSGVAAIETLKLLSQIRGEQFGVELRINKGLALGSGLGSSAASAVASAVAVNALSFQPLVHEQLLEPCLIAEAAVSGYHADNVAPSLLGGFLVIQGVNPLRWSRILPKMQLVLGLARPEIEVKTRDAREVLPKSVGLGDLISMLGSTSTMVSALYEGDTQKFGRAIRDIVVEPARAVLVPGFLEVQAAVFEAGALCCTLSGSGPSIFMLGKDPEQTRALVSMAGKLWEKMGFSVQEIVSEVSHHGARIIKD